MVIVSECCRLLTERVCKRSTSCNRSTIAQVSLISAETLQLESDRSASQQLCDIRRVLSRQTASVLSSSAYRHCSHSMPSRVCVMVQCLSVCQSVCLSSWPTQLGLTPRRSHGNLVLTPRTVAIVSTPTKAERQLNAG